MLRPHFLDQCTFKIVVDQDADSENIFAVDVDNIQPSAGPTWQNKVGRSTGSLKCCSVPPTGRDNNLNTPSSLLSPSPRDIL